MMIESVIEEDYQELVELWEASVRATHKFLKEEDIQFYKPLILNEYLKAVELLCVRNENRQIIGFLGVAEGIIEMLFIHPLSRGTGIGKLLLKYAINTLKIYKVDVNEQNEQALGFYEHMGFKVVKRSELDSMKKPYPILHMEYKLSAKNSNK
ncbi:GNAT family N-acetyltransferase [Xanthovirga aplysinae]|uniref:GNAT family N-acetyltransferase n=1 Tax=Xanthovirga aplysinae TaxID=2529853 RepID=UPI0012BC762C|nr:GNAT family N-acetyltransferase [Xanthovirga aplysinae]MTI33058.1 GNAT family N-acetyltransferase [Xanthovirga aplysinae]